MLDAGSFKTLLEPVQGRRITATGTGLHDTLHDIRVDLSTAGEGRKLFGRKPGQVGTAETDRFPE